MTFPLDPLWLNWFLLALGLICLELLIGSGRIFRLGLAALLTSLGARLLGDGLWPLHFALFLVLSFLILRFGAKLWGK